MKSKTKIVLCLAALGLGASHGSLEVGKVADFVAWQIQQPAELAYWLGGELHKRVIRHGQDVNDV